MNRVHRLIVAGAALAGFLSLPCSGCSGANTEPPAESEEESDGGHTVDQRGSRPDLSSLVRGPLVINEVAPHGTDADKDPDYIELYNDGPGQVNLRGYKIRDDGATWSELPDGAIIPAGGFYVINCDDMSPTSTMPGAHVPFKLGGGGDEAHLASPDGMELDAVRWGMGSIEIPKGQALGRKPDAKGPFTVLEKPTRGRPNG